MSCRDISRKKPSCCAQSLIELTSRLQWKGSTNITRGNDTSYAQCHVTNCQSPNQTPDSQGMRTTSRDAEVLRGLGFEMIRDTLILDVDVLRNPFSQQEASSSTCLQWIGTRSTRRQTSENASLQDFCCCNFLHSHSQSTVGLAIA